MNLFISNLILVGLWKINLGALDDDIRCTEEFCENYIQQFPCPVAHEQCSNSSRSLILPSPSACNCCEQCFLLQDLEELCVKGGPGQPLPNVICKPGTECVEGVCQKKKLPDPDFYPGYECQNGTCQCAVLVDDVPLKIFGKFPQTSQTDAEKQCGDNSTFISAACSIFVHQAQETIRQVLPFPDIFPSVPRCLPNGQYDPLQCINEMCGCVDQTTGDWDLSTQKVHVKALAPNHPKCFDTKRHSAGDYYTTCERERNDLMQELFWSETDDVELIFSHKVECNPLGEYVSQNEV